MSPTRALALTLAGFLAATGAPAQPPSPTFPSKVELITVDVVVLDKKGQLVPGLTRDDFVVEEDGRPQPIVSFEAVNAEEAPAAPTVATPSRVATNDAEASRIGRAYALVVDDFGLDLGAVVGTRRALASFLAESVRDGDMVLMAATSGDAWWSATIPQGREDLLAIAARLRPRGAKLTQASEYITESEAYLIGRDDAIAKQIVERIVIRWTLGKMCLPRDPAR